MRRWLVLFLGVCMMFTMVSCSGKEKEQTSDSLE